jgi:outer membrane protein
MIMKKLIFVLIVFATGRAVAQQPLTLPDAIATALQNNYDIQLSRYDSSVAVLNQSYAKYMFFPRSMPRVA